MHLGDFLCQPADQPAAAVVHAIVVADVVQASTATGLNLEAVATLMGLATTPRMP